MKAARNSVRVASAVCTEFNFAMLLNVNADGTVNGTFGTCDGMSTFPLKAYFPLNTTESQYGICKWRQCGREHAHCLPESA